ncbi:MAG: hypothetical protein V3T64_07995 [Myxococcota bacterium]
MEHRYFEFVYNEICVALHRRISRYDLWLLVWDSGGDPDELNHDQVRLFLENALDTLLIEEGLTLSPRVRRRLERRIMAFDPRYPSPEERIGGIAEAASSPA